MTEKSALKICPPLLPLPCLGVEDAQITKPELDAMKTNVQNLARYVRQKTQQKCNVVYDLQISRNFSRNSRDLLHLIQQIGKELSSPREQQMVAFSYAALWLYREQISLLKELGELDGIERRSNPQARGAEGRREDLGKGLTGT